jgi:hypothetical protein
VREKANVPFRLASTLRDPANDRTQPDARSSIQARTLATYLSDNCPRRAKDLAAIAKKYQFLLKKSWSEWQDLNLRPPRPERGV